MIKIKNIHKKFGKNEVLKGINLHVHPQEVVVVIGPSGSGKSTLLRCVNALEHFIKVKLRYVELLFHLKVKS